MKSRHLGRTSPDIEYFLHIAGPRTMEFQPFKDFIISFYPLIIHYWIFCDFQAWLLGFIQGHSARCCISALRSFFYVTHASHSLSHKLASTKWML